MSHILDPLSSNEIAQVVSLVKNASPIPIDGVNVIFAEITLNEPDKYKVISNCPQDRYATCLVYKNLGNETYKYVVNLTKNKLCVTNFQLEGIIPAMGYSNGVAFWPWMDWFESGYGDKFSTYIQNMINEPDNKQSKKYRKALKKRNIDPSDIGDYSKKYYAYWNFEMSRLVKPSHCKCKHSKKSDSCDCKCETIDECNCICPEKLTKHFKKGRYFLSYLLDNNNDGLGGFIDGFFFIFDGSVLNKLGTPGKIVLTSDEYIAPPLPQLPFAPTPKLYKHPAPNANPITKMEIKTANPPSFKLEGYKLLFDNWSMRLSIDKRAGLQFYQIEYYDSNQSKYRPIIYKACICDAMVSYDTPKPIWARNYTSSDSYSYPSTHRFVTLTLGQDVPTTATLLDMHLFNNDGSARTIPGAIGIYEEDGDLAWRSTNGGAGWFPGVQPSAGSNPPEKGTGNGARGRTLVIRTVFSGFFYCWIYTWRFFQDGSFEFAVRLGGFTTIQVLPYKTSEEAHEKGYIGEFIAPNIFALLHTHMHCARLDFQLDGVKNSVYEENFVKLENKITKEFPYGTNPSGFALDHQHKTFKYVHDATRDIKPKYARKWGVMNPNVKTPGSPDGDYNPAYEFEAYPNGTISQTLKCSTLNTNLEFTQHNLHVTRYDPDEMYGSGNYPIQQDKDVGLGEYIKKNKKIDNKDIVVWYTMSLQHAPNTNDYPYIQLHEQRMRLSPSNFFCSNPAIGGDAEGVGVRNFNNTCFTN